MSYQLIYLLKQKAILVQQNCRALEVSRCGFYEAMSRLAPHGLQNKHSSASCAHGQSSMLWQPSSSPRIGKRKVFKLVAIGCATCCARQA